MHNLYPIFDEQSNISQVAIFATDITNRKDMEKELRLQKENLEVVVAARTRELRVLSQELIRAQEAERQRVSRELHDEAGQLMVELSLSLDAAYDELPKEQHAIRKHLKNVRTLISRVTKSIRSLARSLRPPALEVAGINAVLEDLCEEYSNFSRMPVSYLGQEIELPDVVSISLYRFVQETLTNVVKHAKASLAEVRLEILDGYVCLTVSDNGKGMNPASPSGGLGLLGIQERAALLGGWVDIQSSEDGTSVKICVPRELSGKAVRGMSRQEGKG
jgi:signal transduction histidine kinase